MALATMSTLEQPMLENDIVKYIKNLN